MSEPWDLTATEIVARIPARELTASALVAGLLDRIGEFEPEVLAWAALDVTGAEAQARARDEEVARGQIGPLQGVPVGIKDIIDVAGLSTAAGFEPFHDRVAERDATIVARLRDAGAIMLGKTHTTQFAHGDPAPTRNPWNTERTPGGSSSGSAAAVAARMIPLAVGTQTAGSVLRPAAYCGVVGFKPSFNWVDRAGVLPLAWSLDHVGLIARSVEDVALAYGAVVGTSLRLEPDAQLTPRVALLPEFLERAEPPVRDHLLDVAARLRDAGATVEEQPLPVDLDLLFAVHHVIMQAEVAAVHAEALAADPEHYGPRIRSAVEEGQLIPAAYLLKAQRLRRRIAWAVDGALAGVDAFLLPTVSNTAPYRQLTGDRAFQAPWTMLGTPAITLPTGLSDEGLPIGTQLVGRRGADEGLLALAAWSARALGLLVPPEIRLPEPEPEPTPEPEPEPAPAAAGEAEALVAGEPEAAVEAAAPEPAATEAAEPVAEDVVAEPAGEEASPAGGAAEPESAPPATPGVLEEPTASGAATAPLAVEEAPATTEEATGVDAATAGAPTDPAESGAEPEDEETGERPVQRPETHPGA